MTKTFNKIVGLKTALHCIKNGKGLAKTIDSKKQNKSRWLDWDHELKQLTDTVNFRPFKASTDNRTSVWRCSQKTFVEKKINIHRGAPKQTPFTKKSCVSLVPESGKIHLFDRADWPGDEGNYDYSTGLLFNMDYCQILPEYIFNRDVGSNYRWWYKDSPQQEIILQRIKMLFPEMYEKYKKHPHPLLDMISNEAFTTMEQLQKDVNQTSFFEKKKYSEMLVKLSLDSVSAIITKSNTLEQRVGGITKKLLARKMLNIDLPIVFINDNAYSSGYGLEQQLQDLKEFANQTITASNQDIFIGSDITKSTYINYYRELRQLLNTYETIKAIPGTEIKQMDAPSLLTNLKYLIEISPYQDTSDINLPILKEIETRLFLTPKNPLYINPIKITGIARQEMKRFIASNNSNIANYCNDCIYELQDDTDKETSRAAISKIRNALLGTPNTKDTLESVIGNRIEGAIVFNQNAHLFTNPNQALKTFVELLKSFFSFGIYAIYQTSITYQRTGTFFTWLTSSMESNIEHVFEKHGLSMPNGG